MEGLDKIPTRVFIIGASARAAANSFPQPSFQPIAADLFADTDLAEICPVTRLGPNFEGAEDALRAANADAWIYTGGLENHPALVDRLSAICPLWGNGGDVLRRVRDPRFLPAALAADGLRHLPIAMGATGVPTDGSWLRKPIASAGGGRITRWRSANEGDKKSERRWYYQPYLEGERLSAVFIAVGGNVELLGVTRQFIGEKWTGARDFWYCGSIGPIGRDGTWPAWQAIGQCLARRGGLVGVFGVDAIVRGDEIWPIEINPRYPASAEIIDAARKHGTMRCHWSACAKGCFARTYLIMWVGLFPCWGKAIVFANRAGTMPEGRPKLTGESRHPHDQLPILADLPAPGTPLNIGEPVLTVFAAGDNEKQVEQRLKKRCKEVREWLNS